MWVKNKTLFLSGRRPCIIWGSFHTTWYLWRLRPFLPLFFPSPPPSPIFPCSPQAVELGVSNYNFYFFLFIGFKLFAHLSLTSNLYTHILTKAQLWLLLGCFTLSSFLHIPTFPVSVGCGSQGLVMGMHVVCFYCLGEVLQSLAFHPPSLTLPILLWYQFPSMTTGCRDSSNSRRSSHKGETGGDWLVLDPVDQGVHPGSRTGAGGKTQAFPSAAISHWLWSSWREGAVLPGGQVDVSSWCSAESWQRDLMERVLKLTSNPLLGEIHMWAQLICTYTFRLHSNMHQVLRANCI